MNKLVGIGILIVAFIASFAGGFVGVRNRFPQTQVLGVESDNQIPEESSQVAQDDLIVESQIGSQTVSDSVKDNQTPESEDLDLSTTSFPVISEAPTATSTPIPTPTVIPSPSPSATPVPQPLFSDQEIYEFIERFSAQYSLDPNVVRHIAQCESGFNQTAVNGAYVGLFQFGTSAWVTARAQMGESADLSIRLNAEESVQTASYLLSQGRTDLWPNCMP